MSSSLSGAKRPRGGGAEEEQRPSSTLLFSEYGRSRPAGSNERQTDRLLASAAARSNNDAVSDNDDDDDDIDDEGTPMRERWTHPASGDTFVYPLSTFLEPAMSGSSASLSAETTTRLVVFRVNHGSAVAPFLEFLIALPLHGSIAASWPLVPSKMEERTQAMDGGGSNVGNDAADDDDEDSINDRDRLSRAAAQLDRATSTVLQMIHSVPGDGRQAPRFCGAWLSAGKKEEATTKEYAWFQVDTATTPANCAWVTVHELVKLGRGPSIADFETQPLLWCICDAEHMVPVEIPVTLEPLLFRSAGKLSMRQSATTTTTTEMAEQQEGVDDNNDAAVDHPSSFDETLFAVETNRANYVPGDKADTPNNHALFGRTMYAFHDPFWDHYVAGKDAAAFTTTTTDRRQYAVFLDKTLYLVGECARENAALLAFANEDGYSSVYLRTAVDDAPATTSFVWLVQSSDQFTLLR